MFRWSLNLYVLSEIVPHNWRAVEREVDALSISISVFYGIRWYCKRYQKSPGREDPRIMPNRSVGATMLRTDLESFNTHRYSRDNSIISPPGESMTSMLNRPTAPLDSAPRGLFDPNVHVI